MGEGKRRRKSTLAGFEEGGEQPQVVDTLGGRMHVRWDPGDGKTARAVGLLCRAFYRSPGGQYSIGANITSLVHAPSRFWPALVPPSSLLFSLHGVRVHSVVHQFEGLQRCPIHGTVLETRCRSCGKATRYQLNAY